MKKRNVFVALKPRQEAFRRSTQEGLIDPATLPKSAERVNHPNLNVAMTDEESRKLSFRGVSTREPPYPWMHQIPLNER